MLPEARFFAHLPVLLAGCAMACLSTPAVAQNSPGQSADDSDSRLLIGDIIVTAQKRAESGQKTPLALTALSGTDLADRGQVTMAAIAQQVPNLNVTQQIGQARITMRGVGVDNISTGAESSIAFNQDGVFYSRSAAALASFYDLERIEVLRGPQGTLYGRNATGGSVNLITVKPGFTTEGYVRVTGGNYGTINSEAAVNAPLGDTVAVRIAGQTQHHSGYGRNIVTGTRIDDRDSQAIRGQLLIKPDERLSILVGADYFHSSDRSNGYHYLGPAAFTETGQPITPTGLLVGGYAPAHLRDLASTTDPRAKGEFYGVRLDIGYDISDAVSVRSLSAWRHSEFDLQTDISPLAVTLFPLSLGEKSNQYSQELQVNVESSRNKLVLGAYYLNEKIHGNLTAPFNLLALGGPDFLTQGFYAGGMLKTEAAALYGQDSYTIVDGLRLTLGARYSWERKTVHDQSDFDLARAYDPANVPLVPFHDDRQTFKSFTPKIGIDYDLGPTALLYASWSKGFKAGTYNLGSATPALRPEKVSAFEAGVKATLLDNRLRANIAGFHYNYTDLQVSKVRTAVLVLENAATAKIYGLEGEFTVQPFDIPLTFTANGSWLHARFSQYVTADPARPAGDGVTLDDGLPAFNLKGKHLPQAPDYVINIGVDYRIDTAVGSITLRADSTWSDKVYFTSFNVDQVMQKAYNLQNASIEYRSADDRWMLSAFIRNIANKTIQASGQVATIYVGAPAVGYFQDPRTFGVTAGYKF